MGIELKNICKQFQSNEKPVLNGISFVLEDQGFVSITGKSGSGKSTLLYILSTLDKPSSGSVIIDGMELSLASEEQVHEFRNLRMGFVFQFHYLLPELTALENVLIPARKTASHGERQPWALELLDRFGLANKSHRRPHELSGGEQQRVAIARALIMKPKYIFADEPTGNLDTANGNGVMDLFQALVREYQMSITYVTHDPDFAARATRQVHLVDGQMVGT